MICLFGDDEEVLSENDIAWKSQNWDAVKLIADSFKEKPEADLFKILNNINVSKTEMSVAQFSDYSKFMIDSMLSRHIDCIPAVYTANTVLQGLPDQAHFNYLCLSVPYGRRFSKSLKLDENFKDQYIIKLIMAFYKVNSNTAYDYRKLLEHKGNLNKFLKDAKALATDDFLKSITKNPKEIKELKLL